MTHYTPKSEEQLAKEGLMAEGEYDFTVTGTDERTSKKGNAMYVLTVGVFDAEGNQKLIYDYITFDSNYGERKFRHAADTCGLMEEYAAGTLTHNSFMGKSGRCEIKVDENPGYMPKNVVKEYVKRELWENPEAAPPVAKKTTTIAEDLSDDIPFALLFPLAFAAYQAIGLIPQLALT